ncbi:MAG: hypothetical protein FWF08_05275 [Oscillospiraceae bacterium]|nr:hypothetical protein [Oscillospiraceae bacterium]
MKKVLSIVLSLTMLFGLLAAAGVNASAAGLITVYAWNDVLGGSLDVPDVDPQTTSLAGFLAYLGTIYPGVDTECTGMVVKDAGTNGGIFNKTYAVGDPETLLTLDDLGIPFDLYITYSGFSRSSFLFFADGGGQLGKDMMWLDSSVLSLSDILALLAGETGKFIFEDVSIYGIGLVDEADYDKALDDVLPYGGVWYITIIGFEYDTSITVTFVDNDDSVLFAFNGIDPWAVSLNDLLALLKAEIGDFDYDAIIILGDANLLIYPDDDYLFDYMLNMLDVADDVTIKLVGFLADDGDDGDDGEIDVNGIVACFKKFLAFFTGLLNLIKEILLGAYNLQTFKGGLDLGSLLGFKIDVGDLLNGGDLDLGSLGDLFS